MQIDPTIKADTLPVLTTEHSHIRLMNDRRWPWFIVLPKNSDCTELHELSSPARAGYLEDISRVSEALQQHTQCKSVNIAMLGNVVSALHCHVVARQIGDPNWPRPIWGFQATIAYEDNIPSELMLAIENSCSAASTQACDRDCRS